MDVSAPLATLRWRWHARSGTEAQALEYAEMMGVEALKRQYTYKSLKGVLRKLEKEQKDRKTLRAA